MAKPRVFVSSTYYDLKHIRASLDLFVESLGFEAVLSEKGAIAYSPDIPLDESCYRDASGADIFVLIIGGRYGSEASSGDKRPSKAFFDRYDSVTKKELEAAISRDVPTYILIEDSVYSEYQTYLKNKESTSVNYAHVDSVNVFKLIEDVLVRPRNNPMRTFDRFVEIESWLRDQWAGLFRELLQRKTQQQELATLNSRVSELREINETLRKYLEAVMTGATPDSSSLLIQSEQKRLQDLEIRERIRESTWWQFVERYSGVGFDDFLEALQLATSYSNFAKRIGAACLESGTEVAERINDTLTDVEEARRDLNALRSLLGLKGFRLRRR